jgi:hypothetical protein
MQVFRSDANYSKDASYIRQVSKSMDAMSVGNSKQGSSATTIPAEEEKQSKERIQAGLQGRQQQQKQQQGQQQ